MKFYYVYRLTCTVEHSTSEKYYYGSRTSHLPPQKDVYWSSSRYVQQAIAMFGHCSFRKKILRVFKTREQALEYEIFLHQWFDVKTHPLFFNRANQTSTRFLCSAHTSETKAKLAKARQGKTPMLGKSHSEQTREAMSARMRANTLFLGKTHTAEVREKLSQRLQGNTLHHGKKHSAETRAQISASLKKYHQIKDCSCAAT